MGAGNESCTEILEEREHEYEQERERERELEQKRGLELE